MISYFKNRLYNTSVSDLLRIGVIPRFYYYFSCTSNLLKVLIFSALILATGCKEKYEVPLKATETNYLVVDGFINANGFTNITLRRSVPLKDTAQLKAETNAQVTIASEDNSVYKVREIGNGTYKSDSLILKANQKYRLHIKTITGGEYLSEYVAVKQTPPIDSINWRLENNGVRIFVNTHDSQNNTRYYKWEYEETWEIHSRYVNSVGLIYENGALQAANKQMYYCWASQNSVAILLGSSAQLANDIINEAPILFIPYESEKTSVRYSILIEQYSLDKNGYDFLKMMKGNTESLGSVFDPLPSEITGNITCVNNPSEKVIGYVIATTVDEKRIFISASEMHSRYQAGCGTVYVNNTPDSIKVYFGGQGLMPYQADPGGFAPAVGYYSSEPRCIDCTLRGSNVKPSFW